MSLVEKRLEDRGVWARLLTALLGSLVGGAMGFHLTLGIVVLSARFDRYIYAMHDLREFRWDTLPIFLGLLIGAWLGYRIPVRFIRAVLRGLGAAMIGAIIGAVFWEAGPVAWTAAIFLSSVALVAVTALALYWSADEGFRIPDLLVGAFVLLVTGFAVFQGLQDPEAVEAVDVAPQPLPAIDDVDQVIFVVGDGGATIPGRSPLLRALQTDVESWSGALARDSAVSVLFPGDLVYPVGVRDRDHPDFPVDSTRLWNQINLVSGPQARRFESLGLLQPGNHDWGNTSDEIGYDRIANLEEQLAAARQQGIHVSLQPAGGSPGPVIRDIRDNVRLVLLDAHWFLRGPSAEEQESFFEDLRAAITSAGERHVILTAHHPYQSAGPHGAIVPGLHAWGVGYLLRQAGALVQDLNSPAYSTLLNGMRRIFQEASRPPLLFVGGHDHSLQVLERQVESDPAYMLVSGAGSKISSIRTLEGMHYGAGRPGYMQLVLRKDGAIDLFVIAGAPELLTCPDTEPAALESCMVQGANAFDIVYGQTLATAPERPTKTPQTADRQDPDTGEDPPDEEVANIMSEDGFEPTDPGEFAWWTRQILPADKAIAEADTDIGVPPAAVPARVLYFQPDSVVSTSGASYSANVLHEVVLGELNRHLWDVPVRLPVLDLDRLGGGVEVVELTGGKQTLGLLLRGEDGEEYQFRSIVKDASRALSESLRDTPLDDVLQDQLAAQFPMAASVVVPLLEAVDVLVAPTRAVIMPHHPRLGPYRPYFGGRMGWIEVKPNEREDNRPGFADSRKVVGGNEIYDELAEEPTAYADVPRYLRARFVDFLVGDWDRHSDNWRWARFDEGDSIRWEPIPKDRDWALSRTGGLPAQLSRSIMPQFVGFDREIPPVERIAEAAYRIDRRVLSGVPLSAFEREARFVQSRLTDQVIERALSTLPVAFQAIERPALDQALRARRAQLGRVAHEFHGSLSKSVHVYGFDDVPDTVRFEPTSNGLVAMRVYSGNQESPRLAWQLDPTLTTEVRLFLDPATDATAVPEGLPISVAMTDPSTLPEDEGGGSPW